MKKKMFLYCLVLILSLSLVLTGCASKNEENKEGNQTEAPKKDKIIIKYTHGVDTNSPHQHVGEKFKELVEKYTDGQVEVQIFPNGQLGSEQRGFQDVQNNVVQATSMAVNNASPFAPSLGFFDLPYIFSSREEFTKVIDTLWDEINEKMIAESGNRAIIWFDQDFRVLTTKDKPVRTLNDLKGLKIRVPQNPLQLGAFKAWGCDATPIAWDETFNALQQGVVDGQENPHSVNLASSFQEVQKYITQINYKMWIGPVAMNEKWLQSQPEEIRDAIIRAGKEAMLWEREYIAEKSAADLKALTDAGMEYLGPPEDEALWQEKAMEIWPEFYDTIGGTELLEKVMDVLGREMPR
ncbi:MAG: TRAP transporter substrate-binding protein [Peptococcales bacterium]|jgi:tripartite ATP-independent transporter DctP family solute receptor